MWVAALRIIVSLPLLAIHWFSTTALRSVRIFLPLPPFFATFTRPKSWQSSKQVSRGSSFACLSGFSSPLAWLWNLPTLSSTLVDSNCMISIIRVAHGWGSRNSCSIVLQYLRASKLLTLPSMPQKFAVQTYDLVIVTSNLPANHCELYMLQKHLNYLVCHY